MSGCDDGEFKEHMEKMWAARSQTQPTEDWGDGEDDDDDDSSRGRSRNDGGDDANEY